MLFNFDPGTIRKLSKIGCTNGASFDTRFGQQGRNFNQVGGLKVDKLLPHLRGGEAREASQAGQSHIAYPNTGVLDSSQGSLHLGKI